MKIISVVGARPNFIKIAPFIKALERHNSLNKTNKIEHMLVHTGQHYDDLMSLRFFEELDIPVADISLNVGSGTHAEQVGNTMIAFEKVLKIEKPDWVVVVGDVNATIACSITAKKEQIKVCHIEAGLRSGDLTMPEEINRIITDRLSDLLLTPDLTSSQNLINEGILEPNIVFVGNIMIDTLEHFREKSLKQYIHKIINDNLYQPQQKIIENYLKIKDINFAVVTLHRPANVDDPEVLSNLVSYLSKEVSEELTVLWPLHPRTEKQLKRFGLWDILLSTPRILLMKPLGYIEILLLNMSARLFFTDSGGLQEECTLLGTPCLTLRKNTERPVTLLENGGTCVLTGNEISQIRQEFIRALNQPRSPYRPELWDGHTAERCLDAIIRHVK